jgi:hypothetical protein
MTRFDIADYLGPGFAVLRHTRGIRRTNPGGLEGGFQACVYAGEWVSAASITAMSCLGADIPSLFSRLASSEPIFVR